MQLHHIAAKQMGICQVVNYNKRYMHVDQPQQGRASCWIDELHQGQASLYIQVLIVGIGFSRCTVLNNDIYTDGKMRTRKGCISLEFV